MNDLIAGSKKEAARRARNAYMREWTKKNPDKVRANKERYWERVAERQAVEEAAEREGANG